MKQKRIAIIVDNPKRDLPSCALLALKLADNGFSVFLLPMNKMNQSLFALHPDYVLLNYVRHNNDKLVRQLLNFGVRIGVLDTEGGVFTKLEDTGKLNFFNVLTTDQFVRKNVTDYFVWGQDLYQALLEERSFSKEQLRLTGTPRIDFYHSDFSNYFDFNLQTNEKVILLNSSFPIINPKFSTPEVEIKTLIEKFNYKPDFIEKLVSHLMQAQKKMIDLTKVLASEFPTRQIVFRPHPFESWKIYEKTFGSLKNVRVTNEKTVDEWLHRSAVLVHYECSTAIEASLFGVPALSFADMTSIRPIPYADMVTSFLSSNSEFVSTIKAILENRYQRPQGLEEKIELVQRNLYGFDDGKAFDRIASQIEKSVEHHSELNLKFALFYRLYYRTVRFAKLILRRSVFPPEKKFTQGDVQEIITKLSASTFQSQAFRAIDIGRDVVEIQAGSRK